MSLSTEVAASFVFNDEIQREPAPRASKKGIDELWDDSNNYWINVVQNPGSNIFMIVYLALWEYSPKILTNPDGFLRQQIK